MEEALLLLKLSTCQCLNTTQLSLKIVETIDIHQVLSQMLMDKNRVAIEENEHVIISDMGSQA